LIPEIGVLGELIDTGPAVAGDQVSSTIFEGGSFQAKMLLSSATDPVDVYKLPERFRLNGVYLAG
jgi:hypothetical protein